MSPEYLAMLAGVILSVVLAYAPGLASWYNGVSPDAKRLIMLGLLLLSAIGSVAYVCSGLGGVEGVTCDLAGAVAVFKVFIAAIIANQGAFALLPKVGANK